MTSAASLPLLVPSFRDPFNQSLYPVLYVLAATTVTAYMLVIMLLVTPRSVVGPGVVYLGHTGFSGTPGGGVVRVGGRPWLQKVAAATVALSLTIASIETFSEAETQYYAGIHDAQRLLALVMESPALRVMRLISDTFLWLAQTQTLIRLFPRRRERVIIKWTAFALITLQIIFSALNSFYTPPGNHGNARPDDFTKAVPALSYTLHLTLGFLYAAWVIYYALMKKRYAFYHPLMKNMLLVSALSLMSLLLPVAFFILDVSNPRFIGWGDYVRWVGAAAASVAVWEWVERIEALEREGKKDGILGREVFEGDEMMEASPPALAPARRGRSGSRDSPPAAGGGGDSSGITRDIGPARSRPTAWPGLVSRPFRYQHRKMRAGAGPSLIPMRPVPAAAARHARDTASTESTDYTVRRRSWRGPVSRTLDGSRQDLHETEDAHGPDRHDEAVAVAAQHHEPSERERPQARHAYGDRRRRDLRSRLRDFGATRAESIRQSFRNAPETDGLPVRVVAAPPRRGEALAQLVEGMSDMPQGDLAAQEAPSSRRSSSQDSAADPAARPPPLWPGVRQPPDRYI